MVSMKEIAELAGVSRTTVSFVLNGRYREDIKISDSVVKKVLQAAREAGYVRNELACSVLNGKSRVVAFMCDFYAAMLPILQGYADAAQEAGYAVKLICYGPDINGILKKLIGYRVEGITAVEMKEELKKQIHPEFFKFGIPQEGLDMQSGSLSFDQTSSAEVAVEHLVKLGHRKIVCVTMNSNVSHQREKGYLNIMNRNGLSPMILPESAAGFEKLLQLKPEGVFCVNDCIAMHLMLALYRRKLFVPDVFSLVGFSDVPGADSLCPPLTTVEECGYESGRRAFESLLFRINHGHPMEFPPPPLTGKLVLRESTAKNTKNGGKR